MADGLRVLIAGGGTGGHVVPALAIARELRDVHGATVEFIGTSRGLEARLVPQAGFPLHLVRSGQLNNVSLAIRMRTLADLPTGAWECVGLLRRFRPHVVVGVGGYASGPGMMAAILLCVPTLAFEPNAVPGLTNRVIGKWISAAAVNFDATRRYFRNARVTGIPVRKEFFASAASQSEERAGIGPALLVFGGSLGARIFNTVMPKIASRLLQQVPGLRIVHQCGGKNSSSTEELYRASGADASRWTVVEFLDDMPRYFAEADVLLCRSGASTVAEIAASGKPAVLVPLPGAADDHQLRNAEVLERAGAAVLRRQDSPDFEEQLAKTLTDLLLDRERRTALSQHARTLARPDALRDIGQMVSQLPKGSF